jgi:hypothetical protein
MAVTDQIDHSHEKAWGSTGSNYEQDPYRPWDNWCVCLACDPEQEHRFANCPTCDNEWVEILEHSHHKLDGLTPD